MEDFGSSLKLQTVEPAPERLTGIEKELDLARQHLTQAIDKCRDDPVAFLALAETLDAIAAITATPPELDVNALLDQAIPIVIGGTELRDRVGLYELTRFRWLWPHDWGRLSELFNSTVDLHNKLGEDLNCRLDVDELASAVLTGLNTRLRQRLGLLLLIQDCYGKSHSSSDLLASKVGWAGL